MDYIVDELYLEQNILPRFQLPEIKSIKWREVYDEIEAYSQLIEINGKKFLLANDDGEGFFAHALDTNELPSFEDLLGQTTYGIEADAANLKGRVVPLKIEFTIDNKWKSSPVDDTVSEYDLLPVDPYRYKKYIKAGTIKSAKEFDEKYSAPTTGDFVMLELLS